MTMPEAIIMGAISISCFFLGMIVNRLKEVENNEN